MTIRADEVAHQTDKVEPDTAAPEELPNCRPPAIITVLSASIPEQPDVNQLLSPTPSHTLLRDLCDRLRYSEADDQLKDAPPGRNDSLYDTTNLAPDGTTPDFSLRLKTASLDIVDAALCVMAGIGSLGDLQAHDTLKRSERTRTLRKREQNASNINKDTARKHQYWLSHNRYAKLRGEQLLAPDLAVVNTGVYPLRTTAYDVYCRMNPRTRPQQLAIYRIREAFERRCHAIHEDRKTIWLDTHEFCRPPWHGGEATLGEELMEAVYLSIVFVDFKCDSIIDLYASDWDARDEMDIRIACSLARCGLPQTTKRIVERYFALAPSRARLEQSI